jgi:hypothetical protein
MTKTYTLAIGSDMLLATVVDGADIDAAVAAYCVEANCDPIEFEVKTGCTLTDHEPETGEIVWHSGNSGWIFDDAGETRKFATRA